MHETCHKNVKDQHTHPHLLPITKETEREREVGEGREGEMVSE